MTRRAATQLLVGLVVLAGLGVVAGANVHLVSVAVTSQPDCVLAADAPHRPARQSC